MTNHPNRSRRSIWTHRHDRPWLKITYDSCAPGTAKVARQRKRAAGQWVVFDKMEGGYWRGICLFASGDINDCYAFIEREADDWRALEDAERFSG